MPLPDSDTQVKASSEAAETFVSHYYQALNSRSTLLPFYINSSSRYSIAADISINGSVLAAPADYTKLLDAQGQGVRYEIESLDAHVINPSSQYGAPEHIHDNNRVEKNGGRMTIVVTTMGRVQFGKGREAPRKMFNETFVLVPNWDSMARNPPRGIKRWLIMSQNFRAL
ncbi:Nuclear transport factor 2 domain containing protein [Metarhizium album ARSEF 1941]|uniref:Nuclear transport factor 2 domain containing protein n=1 Tax=Metarhizium album (strain ARSEF 1941) TaxID=1081103 RepID=A0A0B2WPN6_METAS|nr:Nuclear transport factor 2 domain containing protein [Metarhizium album ARSEF 1941]KHN95599.1 Nuclear transport factor 2 domain containing protein [Metarhizium album ARSEF 1941]